MTVVAGIKERYKSDVIPAMMREFRYSNLMQVPKLEKVVINIGVGEAVANPKMLDIASLELAQISGQRPVITRAKKSIAGFKVRRGMPIGCKVTLRSGKMYAFLDRLIHTALPRIRDFRGISPKTFDGMGNYTLGLKEQLIFPEVHYDDVTHTHGMDITIVTTASSDAEGLFLLKQLRFPFREAV